MFKHITLLLFITSLLVFDGWGQTTYLSDDFEDNNITGWTESTASRWGASANGKIAGSYSLKHTFVTGTASNDQISTPFSGLNLSSGPTTWKFKVKHGILPSANNNWAVFIISDAAATDMKPSGTANGYAVGVNYTGSGDLVTLWKITAGVATAVITSTINWETDASLGTSGVGNIEITRTSSGGFVLKIDKNNDGTFDYTSSETSNTDFTTCNHFGVYFKYTSTGDQLLWVDDISVTQISNPPTLTADGISNNVDNNIDITFPDNSAWRTAITAVKVGGTALTVTTDYVISSGNIQLKPSGGSSLLRTSGSKTVTVEATGYATASVTQQIDAGAPTGNSTAAIDLALASNTTRTVTATAKDQYTNLVSGYTFKYDVTVTNANATTSESYTIDGTARTASVPDISVTATTNGSGVATFTIAVPAVVDESDGVSVQVQLADGTTNVGSAFGYTEPLTTPTLNADVTQNNVDNNIDITFTDNSSWRAAITAVKIGGTALTLTTDYVITEGNLQLKPSGLNSLLTTAGSKSVTVEATGYAVASVTQQIDAGSISTSNSSASISASLALNTTRTITITAKDQYNNPISGYTFKYDATITNNNATTTESYSIDGVARTSTVTDINVVTATNSSGVATFPIIVPSQIDQSDGLTIQVQLADGTTNLGSPNSISGPAPGIVFTGIDPTTNSFLLGSTNNILYRIKLDVTNNPATLNGAAYLVEGSFLATDISASGYKLYYSTDATLDLGTDQLLESKNPTSNNSELLAFTPTKSFAVGTGYLFLTVDLVAGAVRGNSMTVFLPTSADFTFTTSVSKSGTFGTAVSHTFIAVSPTLTADNTDNTVDNNIDITFTDDATWRGAITAVKIGGTALTLTTDYEISAGYIRLKPSGGNTLLRTFGSKSVTVEATAYSVVSVTQDILVGSISLTYTTAAISAALAINTSRTVTVTAKDQYNNAISGYTFKYDVVITNNTNTTNESYTINGTARTSSIADVSVSSTTNASGVVTFAIVVPTTVDENDGISVQVQLADGTTNVGTSFSFTKLSPSVLAAGDMAILAAQSGSPEYVSFILLTSVNPLTEVLITDNGWRSTNVFRTGEGILKWTSPSSQLPTGTIINITTGTPSVNIGSISVVSGTFALATQDQVLIYQGASTFITAVNINTNWAADATTSNNSAIPSGLTNGTNCLYIANENGYYSSSLSGTVATDRSRINNSNNWTLSASVQSVPYYGNTNTVTISNVSQTSNNLTSNVLSNITFTGLSTTGSLVVNQYYTPPTGKVGIAETNVGSYRWFIDNSGINFTSASFRFDIFRLPGYGGISENASGIKLYKRSTEGSGSWTLVGTLTYNTNGTAGNRTDDYLTISGITSFSEFVMASNSEPLPVELTSFTASSKGTIVTLNWETKTEVDNNGFEVERNVSGNWDKIGFVEGHGTANSPKYYSFVDNGAIGNKIQYRLKQIDNDGTFEYSPEVEVELNPITFALYQNYPNPFNPSTIIRFSMPVNGNVALNVFNTLGEKVATLLNGQLEAGYHEVSFDAQNLPSGLYFYEIKTGDFSSIKKMILIK